MAQGADETPVIKTIATTGSGLAELAAAIEAQLEAQNSLPEKHLFLLTEKCWQLIQAWRMRDLDHKALHDQLKTAISQGNFNLYAFARSIIAK